MRSNKFISISFLAFSCLSMKKIGFIYVSNVSIHLTFQASIMVRGIMTEKKTKVQEIPCRMSDTFGGTGGRESHKKAQKNKTARSSFILRSPPSLYNFFIFFYHFFFVLKFLCTPFFVQIHCTAIENLDSRVNSSIQPTVYSFAIIPFL
jgi:hypothetical protein